ncbi:uncharacterized protein [Dermacentor albipictus]|uniref:uncharacterized protein isoform X2 n=1 Tax=Dermacentor albipictus TaxID=60249 RepID=UPI0038FBFE35
MRGATEERRPPLLAETRTPSIATKSVCSPSADSGIPPRASRDVKPETPEEPQPGPKRGTTDGAELSSSAECCSSHAPASPDSAMVVESTIDSTSLCESQDATSVTSLRATSGGRGHHLSPAAAAARRRRALRTFWQMHKKALLFAFFVVFIVGCLVATALDHRRTVLADLADATMTPSEKDASHVMDAPAMPTVPFYRWNTPMMSFDARAISTTPSPHGGDGDEGELAPVPTSVETEGRIDRSDALNNVQAHDEETPWTAAMRLESTKTTRWERGRLPAVSTSRRWRLREFSDEGGTGSGIRIHAPVLPRDVLHDPFGSSDHFTKDQFEPLYLSKLGTKKLRPNALPSMFIHRKLPKPRKPPLEPNTGALLSSNAYSSEDPSLKGPQSSVQVKGSSPTFVAMADTESVSTGSDNKMCGYNGQAGETNANNVGACLLLAAAAYLESASCSSSYFENKLCSEAAAPHSSCPQVSSHDAAPFNYQALLCDRELLASSPDSPDFLDEELPECTAHNASTTPSVIYTTESSHGECHSLERLRKMGGEIANSTVGNTCCPRGGTLMDAGAASGISRLVAVPLRRPSVVECSAQGLVQHQLWALRKRARKTIGVVRPRLGHAMSASCAFFILPTSPRVTVKFAA